MKQVTIGMSVYFHEMVGDKLKTYPAIITDVKPPFVSSQNETVLNCVELTFFAVRSVRHASSIHFSDKPQPGFWTWAHKESSNEKEKQVSEGRSRHSDQRSGQVAGEDGGRSTNRSGDVPPVRSGPIVLGSGADDRSKETRLTR